MLGWYPTQTVTGDKLEWLGSHDQLKAVNENGSSVDYSSKLIGDLTEAMINGLKNARLEKDTIE